jgi:hypothetical protein
MANATVRDEAALRRWDLGLWAAQAALAALFTVSGAMRAFLPPEQLARGHLSWADSGNWWWLQVSGWGLLLAALALVLPPVMGMAERLVPATATFMALVMVITFASHIVREQSGWALVDLIVGGLCGFVAWGRVYKIRY